MIIRLSECEEVVSEQDHLVMRALLKVPDSPDLSITWVRIHGDHGGLRSDEADRAYYIIDGTGKFTIGDEPEFEIGADDVVYIPRGVDYIFSGTMTYLVMNSPAFRPGSDIRGGW